MSNKSIIIIISSPSGAGKTTICKQLVRNNKLIDLSISYTSRLKRKGEVNGLNYYFVSKEKFVSMVKKNHFIEYAKVFGNFYGSPKKNIKSANQQNKDIIFDIDWQGAKKIRKKFPKDKIIDIFILPPSIHELKRRLIKRGRDNSQEMKKRMSLALSEISHYNEYKYILVNENIKLTVNKIKDIIKFEKNVAKERTKVNFLPKN